MGAACSKSGTLEGGHRVVAVSRTLGDGGGGGEGSAPVNPRQAALVAAERRQQEVSQISFVKWRRRRSSAGLSLHLNRTATKKGDKRKQPESRQTFGPACGEECQQGTRTSAAGQTRGKHTFVASSSSSITASLPIRN